MSNPNSELKSSDPKLLQIQIEIERTKGVMKDNINKAMERGQKLEETEAKTEKLKHKADEFNNSARSARMKMCWQNWRTILLIFLIILIISVILYFILRPRQ